jgi:hypothetical protein
MFGIHYPLHPILVFKNPWECVACIEAKVFVLIPQAFTGGLIATLKVE